MLIFIALFSAAIAVISWVIGFILASAQAIMSFLLLIVLACVAIAIFSKNNRAWTWMFIGVLIMVGMETLAPHAVAVVKILAAIVAAIATVSIKRPMLQYVRRDRARPANVGGPRLHPAVRFILTII